MISWETTPFDSGSYVDWGLGVERRFGVRPVRKLRMPKKDFTSKVISAGRVVKPISYLIYRSDRSKMDVYVVNIFPGCGAICRLRI